MMRIGIVSDSHGHWRRLDGALEALVARGAEAIVHCGDVGSAECMHVLGRAGVPAYAVRGNMDRGAGKTTDAAAAEGVTFHDATVEVPLAQGEHLIATHGDDALLVQELLIGQQFPYLCHGHTHCRRDERVGRMRIINPGALRRARPPSVALLDTQTDELTFIEDFC